MHCVQVVFAMGAPGSLRGANCKRVADEIGWVRPAPPKSSAVVLALPDRARDLCCVF